MAGLARPEFLATTEWLAGQIGRPGLRVLDLRWRPDGGAASVHAVGHIPGAVAIDWRTDLAEPTAGGDAVVLANPERIAEVAERAGIAAGSTVVVYDDSQSVFAARAWWSLRACGLETVRVLDGGYPAWVSEGRPIANAEADPMPAGFIVRAPNRTRLTTADVQGLLGAPDVALLDARSPAEYKGFQGNAKRLGHLPGAINLPVGATSEPGAQRLRDATQLHAWLRAANVDRYRRVVCYDGSGVAAAKLAFVLTLLGHEDVGVYDGGWAEWGNRLDLPVDR